MATISGLPEYNITQLYVDWNLKELRFTVKLTTEQYVILKSSCIITLPEHKISISDTTIELASPIAKLVKLIVHNQQYTGEFLVRLEAET